MRFDEDFGRFLALAVAIRRRDEVAVKQFASKIATELVEEFETEEATKSVTVRNPEGRKRQEEKLEERMAEHMAQLKGLVDIDGIDWLRDQIHS